VEVDVKVVGYTMTVVVDGLDPNTGHEINTHFGHCDAQDLTHNNHVDFVKADARGTLMSVTNWAVPYLVTSKGLILTIHGNDKTLEAYTHIGCADLTN